MNSALKPVLPQPGVPQPGGQASPAKANVASANHAVGLPQGAQNSLHHGSNNLVGQNLTHHVNAPQPPAHAVPSMAPVTANMAQMAQNMSHHGNLSHVTQNSIPPPSPSKSAATGAPLSLVQEKANTSQPLALTRTPEKKEPDSSSHANGTIESSKSGSNTPTSLKAQNPESNKDKQDIAKTSPSTPKPPEKSPEKPSSTQTQCTPQKNESLNPVNQQDSPAQPKVATASEAPEKSPSKPTEPQLAPNAEIAPTQSDNKPVPETANDSQDKLSTSTIQVQEPVSESPKPDSPTKPEEKKIEPSEKPPQPEEKSEEVKENAEPPKQEEQVEKSIKQEEKVEEKKPEVKTPIKPEVRVTPKSTLKLATVTPPMRKRRQLSPMKTSDGATPAKKSLDTDFTPDTRIKRNRTKVQLYQSPTPEIAMATKLSASAGRSTPTKPNDDKLIVFYKNEYLAVRNAEGGFYVCQAVQNVYRTTRKIKIRWLSQDKSDTSGETYKPDFYDVTDMECVLTTLSLTRAPSGGGAQLLKAAEEARAKSILERAIKAEQSGDANNLELTEEHPDGLDLSLYTDESQLEKKGSKRNSSKSTRSKQEDDSETAEEETPIKKARSTPKRSSKSSRKSKSKQNNIKRKSAGSSPVVAASSKTATAVTDKTKQKATPSKRAAARPAKAETPLSTPTRKGRRAGNESKASPMVPTPSTSTGKATRTPRKPPSKK